MTGNKILPKNTNTNTPAESDHSEDAPGAPGGQFYIHNSGGRKTGKDFNITTIVDYTKNPTSLSNVLSKYGEQYNYHYSKGTFYSHRRKYLVKEANGDYLLRPPDFVMTRSQVTFSFF